MIWWKLFLCHWTFVKRLRLKQTRNGSAFFVTPTSDTLSSNGRTESVATKLSSSSSSSRLLKIHSCAKLINYHFFRINRVPGEPVEQKAEGIISSGKWLMKSEPREERKSVDKRGKTASELISHNRNKRSASAWRSSCADSDKWYMKESDSFLFSSIAHQFADNSRLYRIVLRVKARLESFLLS